MSVVLLNRLDNPLLFPENLAQAFGLAVAEFEHEPPVRFQERPALRRQSPPIIQSIPPHTQRPPRIMISHFWLQQGDFSTRDVRRIADDQIVPNSPGRGGKTVPLQE